MDETTRRYTVLLVEDDNPLTRAVKATLADDPELDYIGCVLGREPVEAFITEHAPDLVLVDMQLPPPRPKDSYVQPRPDVEEGLWTIARIKALSPQSRVIAFSNYFLGAPRLAQRALECGAGAVLTKQYAPNDDYEWGEWLRRELRAVAKGFWRPDAVVAGLLAENEEHRMASRPAGIDDLSRRELEVLKLLAAGNGDDRIAEALVIEPSTVRSHVRNVMGKLHARSRREAISRARDSGLVADLRSDHGAKASGESSGSPPGKYDPIE